MTCYSEMHCEDTTVFLSLEKYLFHTIKAVKLYTELYIKCITNFKINNWHIESHSSQISFLLMLPSCAQG